MSAPRPSGTAALVRLRLSGVAFIVVLAMLVGLTVLLYQKAFTPVAKITLKADRIGNQLSAPADVKLRGLIVGEVRGVSSNGNGADVDLAIQPSKLGLIPKNVEAQLLPKTLFGEKFVELVLPESPSSQHLKAGDVIPQDRSTTALETERVIDDLLPLLQSLKPAQLSLTLNALSSSLRGRGERLGSTLELVNSYFTQLNPELPKIQEDFVGLADLTQNYADAAPDLLRVLDNFSAVGRNTVDQKQELAAFLSSTATFASTADSFLRSNEQRLITLASASKPSLEVYARYSPEFPCMADGLTTWQPRVERSFGGLQPGLHITLEVTKDNGAYTSDDRPRFLEDRGPQCYGLPKPKVPAPDINYKDGYKDGQSGTTASASRAAAISADPALYLAQPQVQRRMLDSVVAPVMGVGDGEVPDIAELLFGPVARGTTVGLT
jgi:phospholipid/cholesterol/gamma-HCH transport system substrate-binding protein